MVWRAEDPQGDEAGKVKYEVVQFTRGRGLDIGCGPKKAFPHFVGVDSCKDTELFGIPMQPDVVVEDACLLPMFDDGSQDFVFSSHLLEHIEDYRAALAEWWRVIRVGGHLVLYLPHKNFYPNVGQPGANPDHRHDFMPIDIRNAMVAVAAQDGFDLKVCEPRNERREYSFLMVFEKRGPAQPGVDRYYESWKDDMQIGPKACVVRYGGFGDMLQASNILPALKDAGFHVTVMTTPKGQEILSEDPHVDAWFIQDNDQVPNHELTQFWQAQARRYDKFINLSESVEGTLLAIPGRANFYWPDSVRRARMGINYLEWTSEIAELPYESRAKFYPRADEIERAGIMLEPDKFNVVFALAGSSVHKFWPHQDALIARCMMELPDVVFHLVGDHACQILEAGWEQESRVRLRSGELSIRDTLTLAVLAQAVVGPETGVLNAVAFEPDVLKVILLSHSSRENLTKHWVNTETLVPPPLVSCYPCHRLHYGSQHCHQDQETGAAICQQYIDPALAFDAIRRAYERWRTR